MIEIGDRVNKLNAINAKIDINISSILNNKIITFFRHHNNLVILIKIIILIVFINRIFYIQSRCFIN